MALAFASFAFNRLAVDAGRKFGRHHLAFYRGWLQGLGLDLRLARATLTWIQQTLTMAGRRHGRYG